LQINGLAVTMAGPSPAEAKAKILSCLASFSKQVRGLSPEVKLVSQSITWILRPKMPPWALTSL
jgi:hypothetical protein